MTRTLLTPDLVRIRLNSFTLQVIGVNSYLTVVVVRYKFCFKLTPLLLRNSFRIHWNNRRKRFSFIYLNRYLGKLKGIYHFNIMSYKELLEKFNQLQGRDFNDFVSKVRDWNLLHGIAFRSRESLNESSIVPSPFALLPSPIKKESFEKALNIQPILNLLYHKLAYDSEFLEKSLAKTIENDDFTRKLFEIYKIVKDEGFSQISLGLFRSDYLSDFDDTLKQVEMNTIASAVSGLISQMGLSHRYVLQELELDKYVLNLPENKAMIKLCNGILEAWKLYGKKSGLILFLVEEVTYNIADQRFMEFEISSRCNGGVKIIRRSFLDLVEQASLGDNGQLLVEDKEVSVVYFRSGYDPVQYCNADCWAVRLLIERSKAIKCPSIQYHLVGTKKVQQVLSEPGVLDKYISNKDELNLVRDMFVDIYSLDQSDEGEKGYKIAMTEPEGFVLKPQREGGGHNIYANDIPTFLKGLSREEASAYILMRLINPKSNKNFLVRQNSVKFAEIVSELGVYGIILGNDKEIFLNEVAGHMLRSREASAKEVCVVGGFGAYDSPFMV